MRLKFIYILISCLSFQAVFAQVYIELGPVQNNRDAFSSVTVFGSDGLKRNIPYDEIGGSAFWKQDWCKAYLYDQRDTFLGVYNARFNFVTNELHYLDRTGAERAVIPGSLNKIIFVQPEDSTAIVTVFRSNIIEVSRRSVCKKCYIQELNQGDVKLLKLTHRVLKTKDSLFGTIKKYYFYDETEYFLQYQDKYERIKRLTKDNLFSFLPNISAYKNWISAQKLQFKKEEDFIFFINYYNSSRRDEKPQ